MGMSRSLTLAEGSIRAADLGTWRIGEYDGDFSSCPRPVSDVASYRRRLKDIVAI